MSNTEHHCPNCGVEMNHHADKVNEVILIQTQKVLGENFNGVIEAVYACATCGMTTKSALPQTKETEMTTTNFINTDYKPRTSRRLRFTYSGLL
jgi:hypothetical protein